MYLLKSYIPNYWFYFKIEVLDLTSALNKTQLLMFDVWYMIHKACLLLIIFLYSIARIHCLKLGITKIFINPEQSDGGLISDISIFLALCNKCFVANLGNILLLMFYLHEKPYYLTSNMLTIKGRLSAPMT